MIERLNDVPDGVIGVRLWGTVTGEDYETTFLPLIRRAIEEDTEIRLVAQIGPDFDRFEVGALWDDTKAAVQFGVGHHSAWKRVALVTDVEWIRNMYNMFAWLKFFPIEAFSLDQAAEARSWAAG
jgi:hypothetical protein